MYKQKSTKIQQLQVRIAQIVVIVLGFSLLPLSTAQAAQITARKLTLGSSASAAATTYSFQYTLPTGTAVKSVRYQFCTLASGACTVPGSWVNTGATLTSFTNIGTGFAVDLATNADSLGMTSAANSTAPSSPVSVQFSNVTNPTSVTQPFSFYVRIFTYSTNTYTGALDSGVVAAAINQQITLTGTMPESLVFCTGATVTGTDCTTATSGAISFGTLFSPTSTSVTTSQMVASTNAGTGYVITVNGATMTSGGNTIAAMGSTTTSQLGVSQFGLNLVVNTVPSVGTAIAPTSSALGGSTLQANPSSNYGTADNFKFTSGDTIANSDFQTGGTNRATDAQNYTISYIVNVPGSQGAGTYTTTLTYICTATF